MPISPEHRRRWNRQVAVLRTLETESRGSDEFRAATVADANRRRAAKGIPPLKDEFEDIPELGFHERARALGLLKKSR